MSEHETVKIDRREVLHLLTGKSKGASSGSPYIEDALAAAMDRPLRAFLHEVKRNLVTAAKVTVLLVILVVDSVVQCGLADRATEKMGLFRK